MKKCILISKIGYKLVGSLAAQLEFVIEEFGIIDWSTGSLVFKSEFNTWSEFVCFTVSILVFVHLFISFLSSLSDF